MTSYDYFTLDVFTDRVFTGNPLAVLPNAAGLSTEAMQAITREFNYSETVFVLPATDPGAQCRLRIFTPGRELPFAGHPTVGTAVLLAELGIVKGADAILQEGVGNVPVRIATRDGLTYAELTVPGRPEFRSEAPAPDIVASLVGLPRDDLDSGPGALTTASCGVPFLLVRVRNRDALARASGNESVWRAHFTESWAREVYVYTVEADGLVRARMFAPGMGIAEDPATGAAAAALTAHFASLATQDGDERRTILQGVEMGRPSRLDIGWTRQGGAIQSVRVGGNAVQVARGTIAV